MKKLFRLFAFALMAVALCNCKDKDPDPQPGPGPNTGAGAIVDASMANMAGEWNLTAWTGSESFPDAQHTVYLDLEQGGTFKLYQVNINNSGVEVYTGNFSLAGTVISGSYSDGTKWASDYDLNEIRENQMIWQVKGTEEKSTYFRTAIPEDVLNRAEAGEDVRAFGYRFL